MRLLLKLRPLLSHCSSRNVLPAGGGWKGGEGERWECWREKSAIGHSCLFGRLVPLSGQRFRLQERYLTRTPWQYLPPFEGTGLLHSLLDSWTPPPQVREQEPNWPHLPQRPSTCENTHEKNRTAAHPQHTHTHTCVSLTFWFWSCLPEQIPCSQAWSFPHWVPSAQGKCRVMHTKCPLDFPVHHKRPHGGCMKGQGLEPSPKASSHCRSMP